MLIYMLIYMSTIHVDLHAYYTRVDLHMSIIHVLIHMSNVRVVNIHVYYTLLFPTCLLDARARVDLNVRKYALILHVY